MTDDTSAVDPATLTVPQVAEHVDTIQTPEELEALRQAEEDGKNRTGALNAIDAKADELAAPAAVEGDSEPTDAEKPEPTGDGTDGQNVTHAEGDKSADATHDEGGDASTVLAQVPAPGELSDDEINEISGGGLKEGASAQQADAAQQMVINRDRAKNPDKVQEHEQLPTYGFGPGVDIG